MLYNSPPGHAFNVRMLYNPPPCLWTARVLIRFGAGTSTNASTLAATTAAAAAAAASAPIDLDPVQQGGAGSDWSWWRERSVLLALSLLDASSEREKTFVDQWRTRVTAGGLDDDDDVTPGGLGGGVGGRRGGGGGAGGVGGGSLAAPAYLGQLLAEGNTIAAVARCVYVRWLCVYR